MRARVDTYERGASRAICRSATQALLCEHAAQVRFTPVNGALQEVGNVWSGGEETTEQEKRIWLEESKRSHLKFICALKSK